VKDTGSYYEYYTTAAGCDSIAFYNISFLKTPVVDLVTPQCLDGADTLWLGAPEGVGYQYRWNNGQRSDRRFPATRAGNYTLEVSNACGSITVSIEVLDKCGVEIFMPTGFTPNGDGRNDVFAVPAQNRGKLLRFEIYDRWGRQIFAATPTTPAWNGRIGGKPAPMGAYAFVVVMAAPNGKTTQRQKGWVMLMR
jgi:gliding motility-associated-like protein